MVVFTYLSHILVELYVKVLACCKIVLLRVPPLGQRSSDGVPDMNAISDIDVKSINENLSVRYRRDDIYTYTGSILVAVNPYKYHKIYDNVISLPICIRSLKSSLF